jgi:4-aminobutyrate aminotransferase-like enzyme
LQYCVDQGVPANVAARSVELLEGLNRLAATHPVVRAVRGRGLLAGLEIADPTTDAPLKGGMRGSLALSGAAMKCGLVIYPCAALDASAVMVAPPLTITADELQELLSRLDAALQLLTKSELK